VGALILAVVDYDFTDIGYKVGKAIGKAFRVVVDFFKEIGKWFSETLTKAWNWVRDNFEIDSVWDVVNLIFNPTAWITKIAPKLLAIGLEVIPGIFKGIWEGMKNLGSNIKEFVSGFVKGFKDGFEIKSPSKKMIVVGKEILAGLLQPLTPSAIKDKVSAMWTTAKNWWNNSKGTFASYTPNIGSIKDKVSSAWTTARNWWTKSKSAMATYTPSIGSIKDKLVSAWNTAKTWWNKYVRLSIPSLSFKVTYTTSGLGTIKKAIVNALNLPGWPKLSFAKNGGMFDMGSLIWAGEAGAEIVANAGGGRTGVMNVDQMQSAVYEGVYAAVIAAMRAGGSDGGNRTINVVLPDGRVLASAVEKTQHERGANLMGGPAFAY
jgi:hypothetical protein